MRNLQQFSCFGKEHKKIPLDSGYRFPFPKKTVVIPFRCDRIGNIKF